MMPNRSSRRDAGMTLIELLIAIPLIGILMTSIAFAIVVSLRPQASTEGRLNIARWEQNLGTWLPTDLASAGPPAAGVDPKDPTLTPCSQPGICSFGSNGLLLTWPDPDSNGTVTVSYRYGPATIGTLYDLRRVECKPNRACTSVRVLGDLGSPTGAWTPGASAVPEAVIKVGYSIPTPTTTPDGSATLYSPAIVWNVSATVNALNADAHAASETFSFTGLGTDKIELQPEAIEPPAFLKATSSCGGPVTLIVDESGSLADADVVKVKEGVASFVTAFAGTPTKLQIIGMGHKSRVLGGSSGDWNKWYDLSDDTVVSGLKKDQQPISSLNRNGSTNWEDALYRAFYQENGTPYEQNSTLANPMPKLVVFFTDGLPTSDRSNTPNSNYSSSNSGSSPRLPWEAPTGANPYNAVHKGSAMSQMSPRGWYRANYLMRQQSNYTRMIGVGVGTQFAKPISLQADTNLRSVTPWSTTGGNTRDWQAPVVPSYPANTSYNGHQLVPPREFLGDLIAGFQPTAYSGTAAGYQVAEYTSGSWNAAQVKTADLLLTTDFNQFGGALTQIALAECGGTLTVQTRDESVSPTVAAATEVTYTLDGNTTVKTSQVAKTGTFDIDLKGLTSKSVVLKPFSAPPTPYTAQRWVCKEKGAVLPPARYNAVSADPLDGVRVTVMPNAAVACSMFVRK